MNLVIDANILFAILIKESKTAELMVNLSLELFTPRFVLSEFKKHYQEIKEKTKRKEDNFNKIFRELLRLIAIMDEKELMPYLKEAINISPDQNDVMYFALALKLKCPIWSNDKKLKEQNKIKIYNTQELIKILEESRVD